MREGSLEPPQRLAVPWKEESFYDEKALGDEMARVFDICAGCRRCLSLCNAFPTLFDLVDATSEGEIQAVDRKDFAKVTDECYLCDLCFMTKCPYVPPHPFNIDFPHLMLRAKAKKFKEGKTKFRDRLLTSTDLMGELFGFFLWAPLINAMNRLRFMRVLLEKVLGVHRLRALPSYAMRKFRNRARPRGAFPIKNGERSPGKVAVFATCYAQHNEPQVGLDLLKILEHNAIPTKVVPREKCCGMPKLEVGDLEAVQRQKECNISRLLPFAEEGYALLAPVPSCVLMYKQELPLLFPEDEAVRKVADAFFDPFEYFFLRHKDGLLNLDFKRELGAVAYHLPCHLRVQNMGQKTREVLSLVPGTEIHPIERCSGHDGTYGVKKEHFETSMKIGRPVFRHAQEKGAATVSSDCPIACRQIHQGMGFPEVLVAHPLTLLRLAYGLE